MNAKVKKWAKNAVRWGIAIAGIYYVVSNISLYDRVMTTGPGGWPASLRLAQPTPQDAAVFPVIDAAKRVDLPRNQILTRADRKAVEVMVDGKPMTREVLALKVVPGTDVSTWPLLVTKPRRFWQKYWGEHPNPVEVVSPAQLRPDASHPYHVSVPYPPIDRGIIAMLQEARAWLLWLAVLVFPITFVMCSFRWRKLLEVLEIKLRWSQCFALTMVGAFWNTVVPAGSTGGDVLKALYASKATSHRTRAVMSVAVDRVLGLLALIILGGAMAATQWSTPECRHIAIACGAMVLAAATGLTIFYQPTLHRLFGLEFIINRLPMQKQVRNAIQVMDLLRKRPWVVLWALLISFPVHITVIISAMLAGMAFGLPLHWLYYWALVPVLVLVGAIPISPQGAGVMEFFAITLTETRGCTVGQALVLTMSVRLVSILWNLTGGYFVVTKNFGRAEVQPALEV